MWKMEQRHLFQRQDFAWILFVAVLIATIPETNYNYIILVVLIGIFQIAEPRLRLFASRTGQIAAIALKLLLCFLLIGWTHGVESLFHLFFLIPVVSAATIFELGGVIAVTAIACGAYFAFLLPVFIDYEQVTLPPGYLQVMALHSSFYAIVGFLVYQQAHAKRLEMRRTEEAATKLSETNRELREAQASLRRSERLAALGQLTAGLAHELRNPLGTIRGSAEMLTRPVAKARPEVTQEMARNITGEVDRMNALVGNFLDFARPLTVHPVEANLTAVMEEVEREQQELANTRSVKVVLRETARPIVCEFDRDLLRVALSNVVQNAIQASEAGQTVEFGAEKLPHSVCIRVKYHGEGIRPEHLENIFNPFFTTKASGVGLGLALVAKIVDEHGGRIQVKSELGAGTEMTIEL